MKVLLANSPFGGGGITTYAHELVACLSKDTDLTVVLSNDDKAPITEQNVTVLYHDTVKLTVANAIFFINLINNEIKPDIVIASRATIIPIVAPFLSNEIKIVTVSHSGRFIDSDYCAVNHKYIDKIIAASSVYNKEYLEKKFRIDDKSKIKVIYNFVNYDNELEDLRIEKRQSSQIEIVYAGGASANKSPDLVAKVLYELLKTNADFKFVWTGNLAVPLTTSVLKKSRLKNIKQLFPEDERLVFPGRIPSKRDYDLLLGGANIFLAPSINEGCSMATLEAHRAGCILMVADYENSNREIVSLKGSGFVVNHSDTQGFVSKILDIINNHSKYNDIYEKSHETFIEYLSYPVWKRNILDVLNGINDHKERRRSISKCLLLYYVIRMRFLEIESLWSKFYRFSIPAYISLIKQFRNNKW